MARRQPVSRHVTRDRPLESKAPRRQGSPRPHADVHAPASTPIRVGRRPTETVGAQRPTLTELVQRAKQGDQQAWAQIVARFSSLVWATTATFRFDAATRDDVFQLTWLRLVDHLDSIVDPERLAGWLATTARRECLGVLRSPARAETNTTTGTEPSTINDADDTLFRDEVASELANTLGEMPDACREILQIMLRDPAPTYQEVADLLGRPIGSIGPTRARCLRLLAAHPRIPRCVIGNMSTPIAGGNRQHVLEYATSCTPRLCLPSLAGGECIPVSRVDMTTWPTPLRSRTG